MSHLTVLLLDTEPQTNNFYITLAIRDALRADSRVGEVILAGHGEAVRYMQERRCDVFLAFGGSVRHHPLLRRLCALAGTSVLWTTEDPYESRGNVAFADCFDLVFTNDRSSLERYGGRAVHLPLAAAPGFQNHPVRSDDARYRYDLLFVGTAWPNRVETINRILAAFPPSLKVKLALPWNQYLPKPQLVRPDILFDWRCSNEDFARFANMSRVVLTLTRAFSASASEHAAGTTPPPRLFEVALAGGAQLVVQPDPEILDYYREGEEIRICRDEAQVACEIRALLDDAPARIAAAKRARARTEREHLYAHRIDVILRAVEARGQERQPVSVTVESRPRILFVAHNRAGERPGGGVELYQEQLTQGLPAHDAVFLYPVKEAGKWFLHVDDGDAREVIPIPPAEHLLSSPEIESYFQRVLCERRIDLVHVHHLLHLPLSLPLVARAYGVPVVFQLHDFHLVCSRFNLINHRDIFCDVVHRGSQQCDGCLLTAENIPVGAKARRDGFVAGLASGVDAFVASTPYSADYVRAFYPEVANSRFALIEMIDFAAVPQTAAPGEVGRGDDALRVAVLGNVTDQKGARTLVELIHIAQGQGYVFEIFGYIDRHLAEQFAALAGDQVRLRGGYTPEEVPTLLRGRDVSLHLSIWPETYMISLTEAWRAGAVPIVTDLGAPGERVTDGVDGLKVPADDAGGVLQALRRLQHEAGLMRSLRANIARKTLPTLAEHAEQMAALYADLMHARPVPHADLTDRSLPYDLTTFDAGIRLNAPDWTSGLNIWDQRATGAPSQDGALLASLPQGDGLPEHELPADDPDLSWELSEIVVDGQRLDGRLENPAVSDRLSVRGWMWRSADAQPSETILRLRPETGPPVFVKTVLERRPELATRLGDARAEYTGFAATVATQGLRATAYALDVLHILPDRVAVARDVLTVTVTGMPARQPVPARWSPPVPTQATTPERETERIEVVGHSLQDVAGMAVARQGSTMRFALRWPATDVAPGPAQVGLRRDDAVSWIEAEGLRDVDGLLTHAEARADGLASASYRLVARRGSDGAWIDCGLPIFVTASPRAYLLTDAAPRGQLAPWNRKGGRPSLDHVVIEEKSSTFEGAPSVRMAGWAFAPRHGLPLRCIARWSNGGRRLAMIVDSVRRQEVAVHLKDRAAVTAGFEMEVPLEALTSGTLRFTQVYERGSVAFPHFARHLRAALGPDLRLGDAPPRSLLRPLLHRHGRRTTLGRYVALRAARGSPEYRRQHAIIADSGVFRPDWYRRQGRQVDDPILDYLLFGVDAGLDPHPLFDTDWYLRQNPEVSAAGVNPLVHYLSEGWAQGLDPGPLFSAKWYAEQHPEIAQQALNPLAFYVATGAGRGDATTPYFDPYWYRTTRSGVAAGDAFAHYLEHGFPAGQAPSSFLEVVTAGEGQGRGRPPAFPFRRRRDGDDGGEFPSNIRAISLDAERSAAPPTPRVGVIAHVYYPDLWPQLATAIKRIPVPFDLFITCPADQAERIGSLVRRHCPAARVIPTANRGRDIAPFFDALRIAEATADYVAVCKVHTKRGVTEPTTWRHILLESVLGSEALVGDVLRSFDERPKLGLVGAKDLYLSGPSFSRANEADLRDLAARLFPDTRLEAPWGFIAGTMFWVRPALIRPLRTHVEQFVNFETDSSSGDGQIAHALERTFGLAVTAAGAEIGLVDLLPDLPITHAMTIHPAPGLAREERPEVYLARKSVELRTRGGRPAGRRERQRS